MKTELEKTKEMYSEILNILNKYRKDVMFDIEYLERKATLHIFGMELKEVYGLNINLNSINSTEYNSLGEFKSIGWFGKNHNRAISWPVNGKQPKDELLFSLSFSTGPYIFGYGDIFDKDYPTEFFHRFWLELKTYNPDYVDEANHGLYWKVENAKEIFNSFDEILKKYYELNKKDIKERKIKKLKDELAKLEERK